MITKSCCRTTWTWNMNNKKNFPGASTHLGHNDTFVFYSEISFFLLNISTRFSRLSLNIFFSEYQKINFHWVKIILIFVTLKTLKNLKKYKIGDRIWLASATRVSRLAPAPISQVSLRPGQTVHDCWWLFCVGNYHQQSCTIMRVVKRLKPKLPKLTLTT